MQSRTYDFYIHEAEKCLADRQYRQATTLLEKALVEAEKFPKGDIRLRKTLRFLATAASRSDDTERVALILQQVLSELEALPAPPQEEMAVTLGQIADNQMKRELYDDAETTLLRALPIARRFDGPMGISVAILSNNLALTMKKQGRLDEAIETYREAEAVYTRISGAESEDTARTRYNRAEVLRAMGRLDEAVALHDEVLQLREKSSRKSVFHIVESMRAKGIILREQKRFDKAEQVFSAALDRVLKDAPKEVMAAAALRDEWAQLCLARGDKEKARELGNLALKAFEEKLGRSHPETEKLRQRIPN